MASSTSCILPSLTSYITNTQLPQVVISVDSTTTMTEVELIDHEASTRGRQRHRSPTRPEIRALRAEESSTLRGRSRRRQSPSPHRSAASNTTTATAAVTATSSPRASVLLSPAGIRLSTEKRRREHCPSRRSASRRVVRRRMSRSRVRESLDAEANTVAIAA